MFLRPGIQPCTFVFPSLPFPALYFCRKTFHISETDLFCCWSGRTWTPGDTERECVRACVCVLRRFCYHRPEVMDGGGYRARVAASREKIALCVGVCVCRQKGRNMGTLVMVREQANLCLGLMRSPRIHTHCHQCKNPLVISSFCSLHPSFMAAILMFLPDFLSVSVDFPPSSVCLSVQASAPLFRPNLSVCQCLVIGAV